ncbi:MAG: D-glycero-beta-D-manno-heptose-7-phosphate kinase [Alphaproteobacteria bacterium]|nr:D-glycero-beta-D-manno-heptose-7-phosphate kinase [Alphaproteobacteria bacterium]
MKLFDISLQDKHILCLGDLLLDRFVYGNVHRISPEAPVPVLKINRDFLALGGAGNVVRNLSSLGCNTIFIGNIGKDDAGQKTKDLLSDLPHVKAYLTTEGRTSVKSRFISHSQQLLRVDDEIVAMPSEGILKNLKDMVLEHLPSTQVVILSDYGKGALPAELCQFVILAAKAAGIPTIVDPKGQDFSRYKGATLLTPNEKELREVSLTPLQSDQDIVDAMAQIRDLYLVDGVLVTRGAKGMVLLSPSTSKSTPDPIHIPAQAREIYDVSGAGDTVIATLSAAVSVGHSFEDATRLANIAAGIVVGKVGTAVVGQEELASAVLKAEPLTPSKIMTLEEAKNHTQIWRRHGLTLGFTNGCFDLLHLGHLHSLKECKKGCDRLIVGLNCDTSIQRLKGKNRPIQEENVRAHVLAALEYVDAVILFEEETPLNLITSLLPDVLFKGADYTVDTVVGADVVHLNGGKVHLIDLKPGYSTTATVEKMQQT